MAFTGGGSGSLSALAAVLALLVAASLQLGSCECEFSSLFVYSAQLYQQTCVCVCVCMCSCVCVRRACSDSVPRARLCRVAVAAREDRREGGKEKEKQEKTTERYALQWRLPSLVATRDTRSR